MKKPKETIRRYLPLFIILLVSGLVLIANLGRDLLTDWDECIYTSYAQTMRHTGDLLTHQWNGAFTLEKPPLLSWIAQTSLIFGNNEFLARLPTVFFALLLITAVYHFGKKYFSDNVAIMASLLLLCGEVMVGYMTRVNTDIGYTTFIFLGVYFWLLSSKKEKLAYFSGLFFALAILIKGPGIVPFWIALFVSLFINSDKTKIPTFLKMVATTLIIALPWHIVQFIIHGDRFIQIYVRENIIQRAKYPLEFHFEGRLFYIKLFFKELFPWILGILILPLYYLAQFRQFKSFKVIVTEIRKQELIVTLLLLILIPLVMITSIKTRIAWYAMPVYPFLVLFLAYSFELVAKKLKWRWLILAIIIFLSIDGLKLIVTDTHFFQRERVVDTRHAVFIEAKKQPQQKIEYLVQFSERQGRAVLNPNLYTTTTWIYGGNPCAVYYSQKKVNYYYSIEEFEKRIAKPGLFVVENGDLHVIANIKTNKIYENKEFTMIER